ncbi:hypothetical protein ACFLZV_05475, partial [Candidatus Margulisiibacteriota bacterium]
MKIINNMSRNKIIMIALSIIIACLVSYSIYSWYMYTKEYTLHFKWPNRIQGEMMSEYGIASYMDQKSDFHFIKRKYHFFIEKAEYNNIQGYKFQIIKNDLIENTSNKNISDHIKLLAKIDDIPDMFISNEGKLIGFINFDNYINAFLRRLN